jgi:hypothetical protein
MHSEATTSVGVAQASVLYRLTKLVRRDRLIFRRADPRLYRTAQRASMREIGQALRATLSLDRLPGYRYGESAIGIAALTARQLVEKWHAYLLDGWIDEYA